MIPDPVVHWHEVVHEDRCLTLHEHPVGLWTLSFGIGHRSVGCEFLTDHEARTLLGELSAVESAADLEAIGLRYVTTRFAPADIVAT